jgi:hypothetical protein
MAQETIFDALGTVVAQDQLRTIRRFASEDLFRGGGIAALAGAAVLLYTGTRVFVELDDGIDAIWRTNKGPTVHPVLASLKSRLLAVLLMIVLGVLLIVVILASVLISAYAGVLERFPILGVWIGPAISTSVHYGLLSGFFTLIYKWLPTGHVPWRYALIGGLVNALLRRLVAVGEGLDVDDDLLAHLDAALDRGRAHVRQQHHVVQLEQLRIDRRLVLEHVEAGAGDLARLDQHAGHGVLVDHLAARGVHEDRPSASSASAGAPTAGGYVAGVCGQLTETMSMRASIWSRLSQ